MFVQSLSKHVQLIASVITGLWLRRVAGSGMPTPPRSHSSLPHGMLTAVCRGGTGTQDWIVVGQQVERFAHV